jgi:XTP/dITP diphosphohydrolase
MKLLIATTNAHKVREVRSLLRPLNIFDIYTLLDFPGYVPPPEEGNSFDEIAIKKAVSASRDLNIATIGDDSGLVVPALGGRPGIFSARFAGPNATDRDNRKLLLEEMRHLEGIGRNAYFECAIAFALPSGLKKSVRAAVEGTIISHEKGGHGFGYDPLFVKHDYNQTFAELEESVKNQVSHRGKALQKLLIYLEGYASKEQER